MNAVLAVTKADYAQKIIKTLGFSDTLGFGLEMLLLGIGTVFSVLILLWGCLTLFKVFFHDLPAKKKAAAVAESAAESAPETVSEAESDDGEIIAVIAAAVAMAESESNGLKFRVVSFKRK